MKELFLQKIRKPIESKEKPGRHKECVRKEVFHSGETA